MFRAVFVFVVEYIHIDIGLFRKRESAGHLKPMPCPDTEAGDKQVNIGRSVRATELEGCLAAEINLLLLFQRVFVLDHIACADPSQGDADQGGAVALTPADVCRGLLVGHQAEIARRNGIAEGR